MKMFWVVSNIKKLHLQKSPKSIGLYRRPPPPIMKPTFIILGVAIVAIVAVVIAITPSGVDAIIANKDCEKGKEFVNGGGMSELTNKQKLAMTQLAGECALLGMIGELP